MGALAIGQGPAEAVSTYTVIDADGVAHSYDDPESAFEAMRALLLVGREGRGLAGIEAAWADNQPALDNALSAAGRDDLTELLDNYVQLLWPNFRPSQVIIDDPHAPAQEPAGEPPAPERPQEPEAASPQPAASAAGEIAPPKQIATSWPGRRGRSW